MDGLAGVRGLWLSCLQVLISHAPLDLVMQRRTTLLSIFLEKTLETADIQNI